MSENLNRSAAHNDWRGAMDTVWSYAPRLQFMITHGETAVAYGGGFDWHGLRADNDARFTIPALGRSPSIIPNEREK